MPFASVLTNSFRTFPSLMSNSIALMQPLKVRPFLPNIFKHLYFLVNLDSIQTDARELENMFTMIIREHTQKGEDSPAALTEFVEKATVIMEELRADLKLATVNLCFCSFYFTH